MARELGISKQKANKMIDVIEFMIKNDDLNKRRWSYYEEYLKNASIKKYRETNPDIDDTIAAAIKNDTIKEAADIRKLGDVAKVGDSQSKKLMQKVATGAIDIYEAHEDMQSSGKLDDVVKKLKTFRTMVNTSEFEVQLHSSDETKQQASFEIKKIIKRLETIQKKMEN